MIWISRHNYEVIKNGVYANTAMFKARKDYTDYLLELGFQPFDMFYYYLKDESFESINARIDGMLAGFETNDTLIIQLPFFIRPINIKYLIDKIHGVYNGKVIAMIHDYEIFRMPGEVDREIEKNDTDYWLDQYSYQTMRHLLPLFDGLIVHSPQMREALIEDLDDFDKPIICQGAFGYKYMNANDKPVPIFEKVINYAGSLNKAKYLDKIPKEWHMNVFGQRVDSSKLSEHIDYRGSFLPEELPNHLTSGFGLVWDSNTYPEVTGSFGEYTKMSYAHKISLYISARIPIIVWSKSVAADWVVQNHLGFVIDDLSELWPKLEKMTQIEYDKYQNSLALISKMIVNGMYTKRAALEAVIAVNSTTNKKN